MVSVVSSGSDKSPPITPMALAVTNSILINRIYAQSVKYDKKPRLSK